MIYDIKPYEGALPLKFGMLPDAVIALLGEPKFKELNCFGEETLHYMEVSLTFHLANNGLVEVGFSPDASVWLQGIDLFNDPDAFQKVSALDGTSFEHLGFIIFRNLGITMTGFQDDPSQLAVTVFTKGRWDNVSQIK